MLAMILFGLALTAAAFFVLWNVWNAILIKRKLYREADDSLKQITDYKDAAVLLYDNRERQRALIFRAAALTLAVLLAAVLLSFAAKMIFDRYHTHKYDATQTSAATCVEEGVLTYQCRYCDESYTEPIPMIEHSYAESDRVEATCVKEGVITYQCGSCGGSYTEPISMIEHSYAESSRVEATCAEEGVITYQCKSCGGSYTEPIPTISHSYGKFGRIEATCAEEGLIIYSCQVCSFMDYETVPKSESHTYHTESYIPAAFWKAGVNNNVCTVCGARYYSLRVNVFNFVLLFCVVILLVCAAVIIYMAMRKKWGGVIGASGLCLTALAALLIHLMIFKAPLSGESRYDRLFVNYPGEKEGCSYSEKRHIVATCAEEGSIEYRCDICGESYTEIVPLTEHTYTEISQVPSTCVEKGSVLYRCDLCGAEDQQTSELRPHSYWVDPAEADWWTKAVTVLTCEVCGDRIEEKAGTTSYVERILFSGEYRGDWMNYQPNGYGEYKWDDGGSYKGQWTEGRRTGEGQSYDSRGVLIYSGSFVNGVYSGHGTEYYDNGAIYIGGFENGQRHGYGEYYWPSGDIYRGNSVEGQRTGNGEYYWPDGAVYKGNFVEDQRTGEGELLYSDGRKYVGSFLNGQRHGYGEFYFLEGVIYRGNFVEDNSNGYGELYWPDGAVYKGDFADGQRTGEGTYLWSNGKKYVGSFLNGYRHGYGEYYDSDGNLLYSGEWEYGERKNGESG